LSDLALLLTLSEQLRHFQCFVGFDFCLLLLVAFLHQFFLKLYLQNALFALLL